jgi:hypothetical protein
MLQQGRRLWQQRAAILIDHESFADSVEKRHAQRAFQLADRRAGR